MTIWQAVVRWAARWRLSRLLSQPVFRCWRKGLRRLGFTAGGTLPGMPAAITSHPELNYSGFLQGPEYGDTLPGLQEDWRAFNNSYMVIFPRTAASRCWDPRAAGFDNVIASYATSQSQEDSDLVRARPVFCLV